MTIPNMSITAAATRLMKEFVLAQPNPEEFAANAMRKALKKGTVSFKSTTELQDMCRAYGLDFMRFYEYMTKEPVPTGVPVYDSMSPEQQEFADTTFNDGVSIGYDLVLQCIRHATRTEKLTLAAAIKAAEDMKEHSIAILHRTLRQEAANIDVQEKQKEQLANTDMGQTITFTSPKDPRQINGHVAKVLHAGMVKKGMTQKMLADASGVSQATVSRYLLTGSINIKMLTAICRALDISPIDLFSTIEI